LMCPRRWIECSAVDDSVGLFSTLFHDDYLIPFLISVDITLTSFYAEYSTLVCI